jgi:hypothetical protein
METQSLQEKQMQNEQINPNQQPTTKELPAGGQGSAIPL